jgi:phosphopantothenoylcysteine decarboxylase
VCLENDLDATQVQCKRSLAVVVCAALSAKTVQEFVEIAQQAGWDVWVIATPNARSFIDEPLLGALTGHPVTIFVSTHMDVSVSPQEALPAFSAIVVVPATFNTLKKWAQGLADTLALTLLHDWMRNAIPMLVFPRASLELAQDPEFFPALAWLRAHGVHVCYDLERFPPNNNVPWSVVLSELQRVYSATFPWCTG